MQTRSKRIAVLACAALLSAGLLGTLGGCLLGPAVTGSGTLARTVSPASGFTGIQASHAFQVRVVPDPVYSVSVTCDDNLLPYLVAERQGGSLRLGLVPGYTYLGVTLMAEVHMPRIAVIDASGASTVRLDPGFLLADPLHVVLSGASVCEAPGIACGAAFFDVSGASAFTGSGTAAGLSLAVSGASRVDLLDCPGSGARVDLSGASEAWVDVGTQRVDLSASGASTFYHGGSPSLAVHSLSGGSRIVKVR